MHRHAAAKLSIRKALGGLTGTLVGAFTGFGLALGEPRPALLVVVALAAVLGSTEGWARGAAWDRHVHH